MARLNVYVLVAKGGRSIVFTPPSLASEDPQDWISRGMFSLTTHRNMIVRAIGRMLVGAHGYYVRLENRIDPAERVVKTMSRGSEFVLWHGPSIEDREAGSRFSGFFRRQRIKHTVWLVLDGAVTVIAIALIPFLGWLPGPNVFLYYPLMRTVSHYRAFHGAGVGLSPEVTIEFKCLPDLRSLEENLQSPAKDVRMIMEAASRLNVQGLAQFLERVA